jgi:hypothetical protein
MPSHKFKISEPVILRHPEVILLLAQKMPDQDGELSRGGDRSNVLAATRSDAQENARSGPGARAAAQAASTSSPRARPGPCLLMRP